MTTNDSFVTAIEAEATILIPFLRDLDKDDFERVTGVGDWQVRDLIVHMSDRAIGFFVETMDRGLHGITSEPEGFDFRFEPDEQTRRRLIAERALSLRKTEMEPEIDRIESDIARFCRLRRNMTLADLKKPCWAPSGMSTVGFMCQAVIQELTLHSWDIRTLFESESSFAELSRPFVRNRVLKVLVDPSTQFHTDGYPRWESGRKSALFRVQLTDDGQPSFDFVMANDGFRAVATSYDRANATLECDTQTFILLLYKRLSIDEAVDRDALTTDGEAEALEAFTTWLDDVTIRGLH